MMTNVSDLGVSGWGQTKRLFVSAPIVGLRLDTYEKMENFCGDGTLWFFYDWDNGESEIKDSQKNWLYYEDGKGQQQTWSLNPPDAQR
ncbi:uncharacterized protein KD926_006832 [Aspergillus affinis]|uniref:uncharacterized protein n=1 Tax=Aspergillus affinis TaxID=1070780 RepID=UPI0022FE775E|nr:uncharacterized protein KD926_006832 [Aspergillus affinis]KAI9041436.1 hypothetical protein KD926_006832 [Aspergillus affinis]